jgi:adenylate kinase
LRLALTAKALVITGRPGVGKTTIVNSMLSILAAMKGPASPGIGSVVFISTNDPLKPVDAP